MTVQHIALKIVLRWRMYTLNKFIFTVFSSARLFSICPSAGSRGMGMWAGDQRVKTKGGNDVRILSCRISAMEGLCTQDPHLTATGTVWEDGNPNLWTSGQHSVQLLNLSVDTGHVYFISFEVSSMKLESYLSLQPGYFVYSKHSMV